MIRWVGFATKDSQSTMRDELGDFLRRRREALSPVGAGLLAGGRRRTPGLRRDEVANLANMSTNYYERLEQGRGPQPSAAILAGLATAFRLAPDERDYLYRLAGHAAPPPPAPDHGADPELLFVMRALAPTSPAFVTDDLGTVVAQNDLHTALFGRLAGMPGWEGNQLWRWFTSPRWRLLMAPPDEHEDTGRAFVANLRASVAERNHDAAALTLVADLRVASTEFSRMWDEHLVRSPNCTVMSVPDHRVGRLDFDCAVVMSPRSRQRLITLEAVPGTATQQRLTRLVDLLGYARLPQAATTPAE
jgi:transcriptional regulator with XRE-family HTH domain